MPLRFYLFLCGGADKSERGAYGRADERARAVHSDAEFGHGTSDNPAGLSDAHLRLSENRRQYGLLYFQNRQEKLAVRTDTAAVYDDRGIYSGDIRGVRRRGRHERIHGRGMEPRRDKIRVGISRAKRKFRRAAPARKSVQSDDPADCRYGKRAVRDRLPVFSRNDPARVFDRQKKNGGDRRLRACDSARRGALLDKYKIDVDASDGSLDHLAALYRVSARADLSRFLFGSLFRGNHRGGIDLLRGFAEAV